jgi:GTPase SAR1 family protein
MASTSTSQPSASPEGQAEKPVVVVCVGMAGSGKTTFMQRLNAHLYQKQEPRYVMNLDPAVAKLPFQCNLDIRDSVNYKKVMEEHRLGPNGAIMTSLNLFTTKVDQVLGILEKRAVPDPENPSRKPVKTILVDTPGQIEVFVWSASGTILLDSLASSFPTIIAYIVDTTRACSTSTFMSNMLYACSILYKTKLPMVVVFNKTDIQDASFAKEWMTDYEAFRAALDGDENKNAFGAQDGGSGYMASLLNSMSLMLEEFYSHLKVVSVSSVKGDGIDDFMDAVREKVHEFNTVYQPELDRRRAEREEIKKKQREKELEKMMRDMSMDGLTAGAPEENKSEEEDVEEPVVDDSDDSDDEIDEKSRRDGYQARYKASLLGKDSVTEDASFAKYLHSQRNAE